LGCPVGLPSFPTRRSSDLQPAKVKANLAKLGEEDRRLAEAQKYCPVEQGNLLGSMGKPVKLVLQGQPVFLCCASCEDEAKANPRSEEHTSELQSRENLVCR